jgi:hypothetical protein
MGKVDNGRMVASSRDKRNNVPSIRFAIKQQHKFISKHVFNTDKTRTEGISLLTQAEGHVKCEKKITSWNALQKQ